MTTVPNHTLNDGSQLPAIGLGTWSMKGSEGVDAIVSALSLGYRLLDSAVGYENEDTVGEAFRSSGLPREEVLITSKVPEELHGTAGARESLHRTLEQLKVDHVDVYLIHWPVPEKNLFLPTWESLIALREEGLVRTIGVSNFDAAQLDVLIEATGVAPALNQVPVHVLHQQPELRAVNEQRGVLTQSYSPLKHRDQLEENATLTAIAADHGVDVSQVALRWNVQHGNLPIPRSSSGEHQERNLRSLDLTLSEEEIARIDAIGS